MGGLLELCIGWIEQTLAALSAWGVDSYLTAGISAFPSAYNLVVSVAKNVCMPVAYTFLTIFLLLDIYEVSMQLYQQGGGGMAAPVAVLKSVFKLAICKWALDNAVTLLGAIFSIAVTITSNIGGSMASIEALGPALRAALGSYQIDFLGGLGVFVILILTLVIVILSVVVTAYTVLSRFASAYVYIALGPIPLSTFASNQASQIGLSFVKGFASVCLQSAVISLALKMFPLFVGTLNFGATTDLFTVCIQIVFYALILAGTVAGSGQVAKSILGTG